jgi:hypothetical protein
VSVFLVPCPSKIGIDIHVKLPSGRQGVDETYVAGPCKISANSFYGLFMKGGRIGGEVCTIMNGHADVGSCHLGEKVELADDGSVVPML